MVRGVLYSPRVNYIEVFYNQKRRHSTIGQISPAEYERRTQAV